MSHEGETVFNKNTYGNVKENKQKQTKRKEQQRRIYLTFAFSEHHVTA